jgi:hypothetical protein
MKKFEVRFMFANSRLKIVEFDTLDAANSYYKKVKRTGEKNKVHGKVVLWIDGWITKSDIF